MQFWVHGRICGIDFSGVVVDAPPGCGFQRGDKVFGTIPPFVGSFAEYVRAPTDFIAHVPTNVSMAQAAVLPLVGLTTLQCFDDIEQDTKVPLKGRHVLVRVSLFFSFFDFFLFLIICSCIFNRIYGRRPLYICVCEG